MTRLRNSGAKNLQAFEKLGGFVFSSALKNQKIIKNTNSLQLRFSYVSRSYQIIDTFERAFFRLKKTSLKLCRLFNSSYLVYVICSFLMAACFQPEVGCLDIEATNFELTADEQCGTDDNSGSCPCDYPVLSFDTMEYVFDKLDYEPDTFYRVGSQYIRIKSIQFYLSNFRFIRANGESLGVEDTISLTVLNEENQLVTNSFEDNFLLINQQNSIDIGTVKQSGQFDSIRFVVGIEGAANSADPSLITDSRHPLATETMHFGDQSTGYIFNKIIITKDTMTTEELVLNIGGSANLVTVSLPFSYKSTLGEDFSLGTLRINHAKWFDGINFVADTDAVIIGKIITNTPMVFSVSN